MACEIDELGVGCMKFIDKSFNLFSVELAKNRQGQSLIQVMLGAALLGILSMAFLSMQSMQQKSQLAVQTGITRNMLQLQLQQALVSNAAISKTLADTADSGNVALKNCMLPSGTTCIQTSSLGFYLFDPLGNKIAGAGSSSPLRYDYMGSPCTTASPRCLFRVYSSFTSVCPSGSPCSNPAVTSTFTIDQDPGVTPVGGTPLKPLQSQPIAMGVGVSGQLVGSCEEYTTYSGVVVGNRYCWGLAQDMGTSVNCLGGSVQTDLIRMEDSLTVGEMASNGANLYTACTGGTQNWCAVTLKGCVR